MNLPQGEQEVVIAEQVCDRIVSGHNHVELLLVIVVRPSHVAHGQLEFESPPLRLCPRTSNRTTRQIGSRYGETTLCKADGLRPDATGHIENRFSTRPAFMNDA
jgi:hypothetical protein